MKIEIIQKKINQKELVELAKLNHGDMIKGVVDLQKKILALGGELHADGEDLLLREGSRQEDLWGFNIYVDQPRENRIKYTSFINIRPRQKNMSMEIADPHLKQKIKEVVDLLVEP